MTRRAIDIDDETWRRIKIEAAEQGITVRELVNRYLSLRLTPNVSGQGNYNWVFQDRKKAGTKS